MKNFSIIIAMLVLAFTVEAQTDERTKRPVKKTTNTSVRKAPVKAPAPKVTKTTTATRSSATRSAGSSTTRTTQTRSQSTPTPPTRTTPTDVRRTTETRSQSTATPPTRTTTTRTSTTGDDARRSETRTVNTSSSNSRERSTGSATVDAQRTRTSQSTRGDVYTPRTAVRDAETRKVYTTPTARRVKRPVTTVHYTQQSLDYRRVNYPYTQPTITAIYWNANMYHTYRSYYPNFNLWYYPYGYRIHTISAYDSYNYVGEVAKVYGHVTEVWYARETRQYYLYIGGSYPYQDFTIILESNDARRFSWDPVRYFTNRHVTVTGLISIFEEKPEVLVKSRKQISVYR